MAKRVQYESESYLVQRCANVECKALFSAFQTVCPYCKLQATVED